ADVADIEPVVIELCGALPEILLDVGEQLRDVDLPRLEGDFGSVAEPEIDRGPSPGRFHPDRVEPPPVADDLIHALPAFVAGPRPVFGDNPFPLLDSLRIRPAVLEALRERSQGLFAGRGLSP